MTTEHTNTTLLELATVLKENDHFVLCGHVNPDGDCIGSQLALWSALKQLGKQATCLLIKKDSIEQGLLFLPGVACMVPVDEYEGEPCVFIACDVPNDERLGGAARIKKECALTITIDHHLARESMSDITYSDPSVAATTLIIWELVKLLAVEDRKDIATCAYTGLVTDTGCFQFQNTDAYAFALASEMIAEGVNAPLVAQQAFQTRSIASLMLEQIVLSRLMIGAEGGYAISYLTTEDFARAGATKADSDPIINIIRALQGIRVACLLRDESDIVRGSLRAKDDTDVAKIAEQFKGGGHRAAAGLTIESSLEEALARVIRALNTECGIAPDSPVVKVGIESRNADGIDLS